MVRMYSDQITTAANTDNQTVFEKQWNVPVTIRAIKVETSDTEGGDLTLRGYLGGEIFLYDSDPVSLEYVDWIPVNAGPPTVRGKVKFEVDNSHATNTPDIKVILLVEVGASPPNNLPWIHAEYGTGSSADIFSKEFDKPAALQWVYLSFSAGTFVMKVGDTRVNGDDEGHIDEPLTPAQGLAYPVAIPANVAFKGTTVSATGRFIVVIAKSW